jgi:toxin YoeB
LLLAGKFLPTQARPPAPARHQEFLEDLQYWVETDRQVAPRCLDLVEASLRDPSSGIGKPEGLKHLGANIWSRRITQEHRLVYLMTFTDVA